MSDLRSLNNESSSNPSSNPSSNAEVNVLQVATLQAELALVLATLRFAEVRAEGYGAKDDEVREARAALEKCRKAVKGVREVETRVSNNI